MRKLILGIGIVAMMGAPAIAAPAAKEAGPDFRAMAAVLRAQRNQAQEQAADLAAQLDLQRQQAARAERAWREYSKPLWDKSAPPIPSKADLPHRK